MAANQPALQYAMQTDTALETKLCEKGLKVLEVYSEWCGPCKSVLPTFKRIKLDKDDETTLQFLTVSAESCDLLEPAKAHRGKSEPLFLLYRNGNLKHKIQGADTPMLSSQVLQLTPMTADTDDLAENSMLKARTLRLKATAV
ncbi:hypothetical protein ABBQ38_007751 [Trebouxia sp. C0009 RCD-2024]